MRAMFLGRRYVEKSKKSGRTMTVLEVYVLPKLKDDGSGELVGGGVRSFFVMDAQHFDLGKSNRFGDIVNLRMDYDENYDRGVLVGMETVQESAYDLVSLIKS